MLMGCKLERLVYMLGYMLAGCQSIVANLWAIKSTERDTLTKKIPRINSSVWFYLIQSDFDDDRISQSVNFISKFVRFEGFVHPVLFPLDHSLD